MLSLECTVKSRAVNVQAELFSLLLKCGHSTVVVTHGRVDLTDFSAGFLPTLDIQLARLSPDDSRGDLSVVSQERRTSTKSTRTTATVVDVRNVEDSALSGCLRRVLPLYLREGSSRSQRVLYGLLRL